MKFLLMLGLMLYGAAAEGKNIKLRFNADGTTTAILVLDNGTEIELNDGLVKQDPEMEKD